MSHGTLIGRGTASGSMLEREKAIFPRAVGRSSGGLELRCVIFARNDDGIVLVRHRRDPVVRDAWTLPGGPLDYGTSPRESAGRILVHQAGVPAETMRLLTVESSSQASWTLAFYWDAVIRKAPVAGAGIAELRVEPIEKCLAEDLDVLARMQLERYRVQELEETA